MALKNEQYSVRGTKSSWRHWKRRLKRFTARLRRRLNKMLGEDAPPRVTGGWSD
jgi:hypothetical protein